MQEGKLGSTGRRDPAVGNIELYAQGGGEALHSLTFSIEMSLDPQKSCKEDTRNLHLGLPLHHGVAYVPRTMMETKAGTWVLYYQL